MTHNSTTLYCPFIIAFAIIELIAKTPRPPLNIGSLHSAGGPPPITVAMLSAVVVLSAATTLICGNSFLSIMTVGSGTHQSVLDLSLWPSKWIMTGRLSLLGCQGLGLSGSSNTGGSYWSRCRPARPDDSEQGCSCLGFHS